MQTARRGTLLRMPLLCSSGMILCWLLPSGLRWLLHTRMPLSSSYWSPLHNGSIHSERGMLLSSSRWFLHSERVPSGRGMLLSYGLGRFYSRMFLRWFLLGGMLL
ncbi:hypothetical protein BHM03_00037649 [Ensete ventricosum]|nr:hypothetical protein BHM03_00037649 [Ensete ventricosum]